MLRRYALGLCLAFGFGFGLSFTGAAAQESTEPPPPSAAPRVSVMSEELPRAGAIVVFGAADPVGLETVKALAANAKQVIAVLPEGADKSALDGVKAEVVTANPLVLDQLKTLFASAPIRAVVTPYEVKEEGPTLGLDGTRNIIDVTKATGVPRLVFVSHTGAGDSAGVVPWYVRFLRGDIMTGAGTAEAHLKASGLDFTVVRAGWILAEPAEGAPTLEEGAPVFSWIGASELARLVASVVDAKSMSGKTATAVDPARTDLFSVLF